MHDQFYIRKFMPNTDIQIIFTKSSSVLNTVFHLIDLDLRCWITKSAFTCNRDEISSRYETRPVMKKFLVTREFHPRIKRVEFIPGWNLIWKKTSHWVWWKHIIKILILPQLLKSGAWYVKNIRRLKAGCIKWLRPATLF